MYYACTFRSRLILTLHPARTDTGQIFCKNLNVGLKKLGLLRNLAIADLRTLVPSTAKFYCSNSRHRGQRATSLNSYCHFVSQYLFLVRITCQCKKCLFFTYYTTSFPVSITSSISSSTLSKYFLHQSFFSINLKRKTSYLS